MTLYAAPGTEGSIVDYRERYDNYIGGQWVAPVDGEYMDNISPVNGEVFCQVARGKEADINLAIDAAEKAFETFGKTTPAERALLLHRIADRIEENLEKIAVAETWENGKAVRETLAADIPLAVDHFRYFAGAIRAQEGRLSQLNQDTVAYHYHEPLGVVGQIIPWNFPLLMAAWKIAPALAAGNCIVMKPAEQTPASILLLMDIIGDLLPAGVLNIVNGLGEEAGAALSGSDRIAKIAFTGSTPVGKIINKPPQTRSSPSPWNWVVNPHLSSLKTSWMKMIPTWKSALKASLCSPSTKVRSAPVHPAPWCTRTLRINSWSWPLSA